MFQWLTVVETLGYILIFPGFLFCFLIGLLLAGIDRKIVAKMQKRVGPPVLQPFYDFFKQMFIPVFSFTAFSTMADVIVILYLLLIPALSMILGGAASGSPYAGVGLSREMVTVIACELPLVLVLLAVAKTVGNATGSGLVFSMSEIIRYQLANGSLIAHVSMIPAAIAFLLIIPGETGSHPFDTAEAETEICEGLLAEYSGAPLAVYKLSHSIKVLTLESLFVALFLGGIGRALGALTAALGLSGAAAGMITGLLGAIVLVLLCIVITILFISLVHAITARLKIEQVFKYYWTVVTGLALLSLVLAWYGF